MIRGETSGSDPIAYPEPQAVALPMLTAARSDVIPPDAEDLASQPLPALAKYLEERAARVQTAARGDAFPPGAEELASKPLPALVRYFDQKEANAIVAGYYRPASSSIE